MVGKIFLHNGLVLQNDYDVVSFSESEGLD